MSLERIQKNLKHLRLYRIYDQLEMCLAEAAKENMPYPAFLNQLLVREVASK